MAVICTTLLQDQPRSHEHLAHEQIPHFFTGSGYT